MSLYFQVEPLLTLREINGSQEEMLYITRMRNVIEFQIERSEDYDYLKQSFKHSILVPLTSSLELENCLIYALSKVSEFAVLVHNYTPFRQWPTIHIDHDSVSGDDSDNSEDIFRSIDENDQVDYYLVPYLTLEDGSFLDDSHPSDSKRFAEDWLANLQFKNIDCFNSMHKSIWRRLYANNCTYFCSSYIDIAAFLKEQIQTNTPIGAFNEIIKRERGENFNQFGILDTIASPYYYVLPHQSERNSDQLQIKKLGYLSFKISEEFHIRDEIWDFYSTLIVDERFNFT
ncbi:uncharacterized protein TNIN_438491 [Trichonephila inaurata madagascariensis]|uniref:Uncharacterized protein n=1 Tax=Trichonephila inaurata madagascariensis TaxID=2747483 RepID=A0A8X6WVL1_9ARAC|nr:uncharacterized protein TNIN_438491 [Trichonephila inaurata madagascariensis]